MLRKFDAVLVAAGAIALIWLAQQYLCPTELVPTIVKRAHTKRLKKAPFAKLSQKRINEHLCAYHRENN